MEAKSKHTWLHLMLVFLTSVYALSSTSHTRAQLSRTGIAARNDNTRWCNSSRLLRPCLHKQSTVLYAKQEPPDDDEGKYETSQVSPSTPSVYKDGDPRQALEKFGSLFSQVQLIITEGSTWSEDELEIRTREFVRTYVSVFVPGVGYAATSLFVYATFFASVSVGLAVSGRGYNDLVAACSGVAPLRAFLENRIHPTWGNAAIALVVLELLSPAILAATLALTPKTMDVLRSKLDQSGWGEDGINERVSELLRGE